MAGIRDTDEGDNVGHYEGEDVSPTTKQELRGWYSTGLAAEIFAVCGVGSFAPVILEQLAREHGVLRSDGKTPCVVLKAPTSSTRLLTRAANDHAADAAQCIVFPFGRPTSTTSFAMYTFSIAVFTQALVLISFSAVADYGTHRKRMLMMFAFTGSVTTMCMLFVWPGIYLMASALIIIGVISLGSSFVLLNAFLPLLATNHPDVRSHTGEASLKPGLSPLAMSTSISSTGVGIGYAAAVSVQIFSILLLVLLKQAHFSADSTPLRFVLFMVGIFWFALTIPGALYLRNRPGPPLHLSRSRLPVFLQYLVFAWSSVFKTLLTALKLRQTVLFLLAWFLLSDAIATVSGTAILFARTELHMGTIAIALLSITVTTSGMFGAFLWPKISRRFDMSTKSTIIACMLLMEIIPLYGLLAYLPFVRRWGFFGLQQSWEIYPLGVIHGVVLGGLSSYCRAFYGELIPRGVEAAFYALYAITDKGSSAVGPTIVGAIVDRVGTIRPAFGFLAVLIALPIPLVWCVDVERGRRDAEGLSRKVGDENREEIGLERYNGRDQDEAAEGLLERS